MITRLAQSPAEGRTFLTFWCPACQTPHGPIVAGPGAWTWNGDRDRPTVSPSLLVRGTVPVTDAEAARILAGEPFEPVPFVCHSFITDGQIQFLSDCTHALAGQTVPIPEWED